MRLSLGVVRSPFSAQKRLLLLFTKQFKSCNNQNNDEDLFLITGCSFAKSISPTTWRKSDKGVKYKQGLDFQRADNFLFTGYTTVLLISV